MLYMWIPVGILGASIQVITMCGVVSVFQKRHHQINNVFILFLLVLYFRVMNVCHQEVGCTTIKAHNSRRKKNS